ncbi:uncharacterized protein LOC135224834 [Macrobrachium nipponense]|uniref:uncharacterized protein LOC135224834 n=1 Tax=Macrobrachium nipponense TaxID=159736 RepID=UPI0030C8126F
MKVVCLPSGNTKELRSLFDSGAQHTFITQEVVEECKLERDKPVQLSISGFWDTKEPRQYGTVTVPVRVNDDSLVILKTIVEPKIPQSARPRRLCKLVSELKSRNVNLADPNLSSSQIDQVKLLVGIDHYFDFIHSPQANGVNLIESSLGYLVAGKLPSNDTPISAHFVTVMRLAVDKPSKAALEIPLEMSDSQFAEDPIQQLWTLESVGIVDQDMSPEDKFVLEEFKNYINMVEGRYEVSLPWKVYKKQLPTNLALSRKRLNSTVHKLKQTNNYLEVYDQIIKEQLSLGFIETVPEEDLKLTNVHYLPHLPVIKD